MLKIAIAAGLMLTPAIALAQLGAGIGTDAYAHGHSHEGDHVSGAAGTPMHKSHVEHYKAQHAKAKTHTAAHHDETATPRR